MRVAVPESKRCAKDASRRGIVDSSRLRLPAKNGDEPPKAVKNGPKRRRFPPSGADATAASPVCACQRPPFKDRRLPQHLPVGPAGTACLSAVNNDRRNADSIRVRRVHPADKLAADKPLRAAAPFAFVRRYDSTRDIDRGGHIPQHDQDVLGTRNHRVKIGNSGCGQIARLDLPEFPRRREVGTIPFRDANQRTDADPL